MLKNWASNSDSASGSSEKAFSSSQLGEMAAQNARRVAGACAHCKSLKIRCEYLPEENVCVRCKTGNMECISRGRKKRRPAPTHEDLQEQSHSQDLEIQDLLRQLDQMHTDSKIEYWISKARSEAAALPNRVLTQSSGSLRPAVTYSTAVENVASMEALTQNCNPVFPAVTSKQPFRTPAILKCGFLQAHEIYALFHTYFESVNSSFPLLDPRIHTPERLVVISPLLFTTICALATRFCSERRQFHRLAIGMAMDAATEALAQEFKTVETCQAYLLLSVYPVPKKNLTDDRRWLLMAIAIRLAQELGMDCDPPSSYAERERLNLTRTWLCIVVVDKEYATQFGRPPMIQRIGYAARITRNWYLSSPLNFPSDLLVCGCAELYCLMDQFWHTIEKGVETKEVNSKTSSAMQYDKMIEDLASAWYQLLRQVPNATDPTWIPYVNVFKVVVEYLRLVILSTGLEDVYDLGVTDNFHMFSTAMQLAHGIIGRTIQRLYPAGILPFVVEAHLLCITFAAAFLINIRESRFSSLIHQQQQTMITEDVERLVVILGSREVALDSHHAPGIFATFLASLLGKRAIATPHHAPTEFSRRQIPRPPPVPHHSRSLYTASADVGPYWSMQADPDLDFSFGHFVQSVSIHSFPSSGSSSPTFPDTTSSIRGWENDLKRNQAFNYVGSSRTEWYSA